MVDTGSHLRIALVGQLMSQEFVSLWNYRVSANLAGDTAAALVAQAYWNSIKGVWRAMYPNATVYSTTAVRVWDNDDSEGAFGEYAVPLAEQVGTRTVAPTDEGTPSFIATGVKLTVGTRVTRPGQKRIPFLLEKDVANNALVATWVTLVRAFMDEAEGALVLTVPALGMELQSEVFGDAIPDKGVPRRYQDTTGYSVNPYVTTQNTRKQRL